MASWARYPRHPDFVVVPTTSGPVRPEQEIALAHRAEAEARQAVTQKILAILRKGGKK